MLHFVFVGSHPPILSNSQCLKGFSLILGLIHFYTFRFTPYTPTLQIHQSLLYLLIRIAQLITLSKRLIFFDRKISTLIEQR